MPLSRCMISSTEEASAEQIPQASWPWSTDTKLSIAGIELIPTRATHASELFTALDYDDVWTHVKGRPISPEKWSEIIEGAEASGRWMWTARKDGAIVGTTSFLDLSLVDARVEIGHTTYSPDVWGSEVNPACKLLLMGWAFETATMNRVQLKTDIRNLRSQAAIERAGATREGILRMYQRRQDDSIRDTVVYSVLAQEWPEVKDHLLSRLMP